MAQRINILSAVKVNALKTRGFYADGGGLYLQVAPGGSKSWVFRFKKDGKARDMGLGPLHTVSLSEARQLASECRRLRLSGIDPIEQRSQDRAAAKIRTARQVTFGEAARAYIEAKRGGWNNKKHAAQWEATFAGPDAPTTAINDLPVGKIDTALVLKVVQPIWAKTPETASRIRGRIEKVLDAAKVAGQRAGENPATWRGHLEHVLQVRAKRDHQPALPYARTAEFIGELRQRDGIAAHALEFLILTATRSGETRGATWGEIDLEEKVWNIPAERMKGRRPHRVALNSAAINILQPLRGGSASDLVFSTGRRPISDMTMTAVIRRMNAEAREAGRAPYIDPRESGREVVPHGFRSTFRDWAGERTAFPKEVAEAALAHINADKVEAAYARGDLFDKRRKLMEAWASYCAAPLATGRNVVVLGA